MTQTSNRLLDEFAKLMTDMAGVAQGVRREVETAFRSQAERFLGEMDLVQREEFEAVRDMAARAREENEALKKRIAALEASVSARTPPTSRSRSSAARASDRRSSAVEGGASDAADCFPVEKPPRPRRRFRAGLASSIVGAEERFGFATKLLRRTECTSMNAGPSAGSRCRCRVKFVRVPP